MKKLMLVLIAVTFLSTFGYAEPAQRKIPSAFLAENTATVVASVPSMLYDVECIATTAGGWCSVYDSASTAINSKAKMVELREGVQFNSKHTNLGQYGQKAYLGITVYTNNAQAIITYN